MSSSEQINFEEYLDKFGSLTYKNKGVSMMPLLRQDRDLFTLVKKGPERCKKYDVVLYKDGLGRYILHRIVKVKPDGYVIRGDNNYADEFRTDEEILGVMTAFIRDGRTHTVKETGYRLYSILRCGLYPVRSLYRKVRHFGGMTLRKLGLRK